jgi:glycosyltransferase involved in cell wall biosynthesis
LCTYNRSESLARALQSAADFRVPEILIWECIVVDNNSTDQTREVVGEFCRNYPGRFRYVFEANQGLSHARNRGIRESRGEVIAFMDDDVVIEPNWLQDLTAPLFEEGYAGSGGRIVPEGVFSLPAWLPVHHRYGLAPLAMFDLGLKAGDLEEAPFGANMAFRRELFETYGFFRTDLGRSGGNMISGEDSEFGERLLSAGEKLRYQPSAVVHHPVPHTRLKKSYFLAWWFGKGKADIRQHGARLKTRVYLAGVPLYMFRNLLVWTLRWSLAVGPRRRFSYKINVWKKLGEIAESYSQSHCDDFKTTPFIDLCHSEQILTPSESRQAITDSGNSFGKVTEKSC